MSQSIHYLAHSGYLEELKKEISTSNINIGNYYGETALTYAASGNALQCLIFLISAGADITIKNQNMECPLFFAAWANNFDCVKALLDAGSEINSKNLQGATPFIISLSRTHDKNYRVSKLLIDRGADITIGDLPNITIDCDIPTCIVKFIESRNLTRIGAIAFITLYKKAYVGGNSKDVLRLIGKHIWTMRMA
jgi:ankyrin repeat protein